MKILRIVGKVLAVVGIALAGLMALLLVVIYILEKGPSDTAKGIFVHTVKETSRMGFVAEMFLSKEEVDEIMNTGGIIEIDDHETNDTDLINTDDIKEEEKADITFEEVSGVSFKGYLLTIRDPGRVFCGTIPQFGNFEGMRVIDMIDTYNAAGDNVLGGVNGGDFVDAGAGQAATGQPLGLVISQGEVVYEEFPSDPDHIYHLVGLTNDNKLIMGNLTKQEALDNGMRDALYSAHLTGPFLVMDGKALIEEVPDSSNYGSGKNPRTAIGQKEDGSIILLVVDGRQGNSIGATFEDLALFMRDLGAVNAAAMDGGTSSQMVYEGKIKNHPYSIQPRKCPTSWLFR